jgi:hypothetical protein
LTKKRLRSKLNKKIQQLAEKYPMNNPQYRQVGLIDTLLEIDGLTPYQDVGLGLLGMGIGFRSSKWRVSDSNMTSAEMVDWAIKEGRNSPKSYNIDPRLLPLLTQEQKEWAIKLWSSSVELVKVEKMEVFFGVGHIRMREFDLTVEFKTIKKAIERGGYLTPHETSSFERVRNQYQAFIESYNVQNQSGLMRLEPVWEAHRSQARFAHIIMNQFEGLFDFNRHGYICKMGKTSKIELDNLSSMLNRRKVFSMDTGLRGFLKKSQHLVNCSIARLTIPGSDKEIDLSRAFVDLSRSFNIVTDFSTRGVPKTTGLMLKSSLGVVANMDIISLAFVEETNGSMNLYEVHSGKKIIDQAIFDEGNNTYCLEKPTAASREVCQRRWPASQETDDTPFKFDQTRVGYTYGHVRANLRKIGFPRDRSFRVVCGDRDEPQDCFISPVSYFDIDEEENFRILGSKIRLGGGRFSVVPGLINKCMNHLGPNLYEFRDDFDEFLSRSKMRVCDSTNCDEKIHFCSHRRVIVPSMKSSTISVESMSKTFSGSYKDYPEVYAESLSGIMISLNLPIEGWEMDTIHSICGEIPFCSVADITCRLMSNGIHLESVTLDDNGFDVDVVGSYSEGNEIMTLKTRIRDSWTYKMVSPKEEYLVDLESFTYYSPYDLICQEQKDWLDVCFHGTHKDIMKESRDSRFRSFSSSVVSGVVDLNFKKSNSSELLPGIESLPWSGKLRLGDQDKKELLSLLSVSTFMGPDVGFYPDPGLEMDCNEFSAEEDPGEFVAKHMIDYVAATGQFTERLPFCSVLCSVIERGPSLQACETVFKNIKNLSHLERFSAKILSEVNKDFVSRISSQADWKIRVKIPFLGSRISKFLGFTHLKEFDSLILRGETISELTEDESQEFERRTVNLDFYSDSLESSIFDYPVGSINIMISRDRNKAWIPVPRYNSAGVWQHKLGPLSRQEFHQESFMGISLSKVREVPDGLAVAISALTSPDGEVFVESLNELTRTSKYGSKSSPHSRPSWSTGWKERDKLPIAQRYVDLYTSASSLVLKHFIRNCIPFRIERPSKLGRKDFHNEKKGKVEIRHKAVEFRSKGTLEETNLINEIQMMKPSAIVEEEFYCLVESFSVEPFRLPRKKTKEAEKIMENWSISEPLKNFILKSL